MGRNTLTTKEFIKKASHIHNYKYNYDKTVYTKSINKLTVTCPIHGDFIVRASHHVSNRIPTGCPDCSKKNIKHGKTKTLGQVLESFYNIYGDFYDYSQINYVDVNTPIKIYCTKHCNYFWQTPRGHQKGTKCPDCRKENPQKKQVKTTEDFINKCNLIHDCKFDYSLSKYTGRDSPITIICPDHGEFTTIARNHMAGYDCRKCSDKKSSINRVKSQKKFIEQCKSIHGDKYSYDKVNYKGCYSPIIIICKYHGEFLTSPHKILSGTNCPKCTQSKIRSNFEDEILNYIQSIYTGNVITNSRSILGNGKEIDIYIPEIKIAIECNGTYYHSDKYKNENYHIDKTNVAKENSIDLIHIWEHDWNFNKQFYKNLIKHKIFGHNDYNDFIYITGVSYSNFQYYWKEYVPFSMQVPHFDEQFVYITKDGKHIGYFSYIIEDGIAYVRNIYFYNMQQFSIDIEIFFRKEHCNINCIVLTHNRDLGSIDTKQFYKMKPAINYYEYYHPHLGYMGEECESEIGIDWLQSDVKNNTYKDPLNTCNIENLLKHYNIFKYYRSGLLTYCLNL